MAKFNITFDQTIDESRADGDLSQHGWVHPKTKRLLGLCVREDWCRSRIARAQAGEFQWRSLREALSVMRHNATGPLRAEAQPEPGYVTVSCEQDGPDVSMGRDGYEHDPVFTSYTLHIACRPARAGRLALALASIL